MSFFEGIPSLKVRTSVILLVNAVCGAALIVGGIKSMLDTGKDAPPYVVTAILLIAGSLMLGFTAIYYRRATRIMAAEKGKVWTSPTA